MAGYNPINIEQQLKTKPPGQIKTAANKNVLAKTSQYPANTSANCSENHNCYTFQKKILAYWLKQRFF